MLDIRQRTDFLALLCLVLVWLPFQARAQAPRPMTVVDFLSIPRVSDPRLSPDGRWVVYVRWDADWVANREVPHIWRVEAGGGQPTRLTSGPTGETSPRWSPDGRRIAFLARRGEDASNQIYVLDAGGGEASRLTRHPTPVTEIQWAPDGASLYFLAADQKPEEERKREEAGDDIYTVDESYQQSHLWRVRVQEGSATQVTAGDFSDWEYALSGDGRRIVLHRGPEPLLSSRDDVEVWVMDADGGNAVRLTRNRVQERNGRLSPDGGRVLFTSASSPTFEPYYPNRIFVVPTGGGEVRMLLGDRLHQVTAAEWAPDGRGILFTAGVGVRSDLYRYDLATGEVMALTSGDHSVTGWHLEARSGASVVGLTTAGNPGDLWLLPLDGPPARRVTHLFDDLTGRFKLGRQERVEWRGKDGTTVEGILDYPVNYVEGRRYPLAVQTHGGPRLADGFGWGSGSAGWLNYTQVLTGMGWAVFKPNYRGSAGYGDDFERDMVGHYFRNSHLDVMAGVDRLIEMGLADPERMVKMGWSAGGHMTNKIITFTDRFRAASSGAGGSNFLSFYAQSDIRGYGYRDQWFGGAPWREDSPYDVIWDTSPLKEAWRVKTPTIFHVGAQDERVPPGQAVEMFRALRANGVPTHLYIAPREPHVYGELRHRLFKINAELAWFERWARGRNYRWETAPGTSKEARPIASNR